MSNLVQQRYDQILDSFKGLKILVLGDLMLDEYLWGHAGRISPEAPVMVVDINRESSVPGGAANVVNNLVNLGAEVSVIGVVGDDPAGKSLVESMSKVGACTSMVVVDPNRPTTRKTRIVAHSQQILRVDREHTSPISNDVEAEVLRQFVMSVPSAQAVLLSDYNKGLLTKKIASAAIQVARDAGTLVTANPKPANVSLLAGATVLSLNQVEADTAASLLVGQCPGGFGNELCLGEYGEALRTALKVENLVVTRGSKGLSVWSIGRYEHIRAHAVEVFDVAGAGDTVISTLTAALAGGATISEAAEVANHAAACVVRKLGVATVTPEELRSDWR